MTRQMNNEMFLLFFIWVVKTSMVRWMSLTWMHVRTHVCMRTCVRVRTCLSIFHLSCEDKYGPMDAAYLFFIWVLKTSNGATAIGGVITEGSQWRPLKAVEVTEDLFSLSFSGSSTSRSVLDICWCPVFPVSWCEALSSGSHLEWVWIWEDLEAVISHFWCRQLCWCCFCGLRVTELSTLMQICLDCIIVFPISRIEEEC